MEGKRDAKKRFERGEDHHTQVNILIFITDVGDNIEMRGNKFSIDYSLRGTAKCRVCKEPIIKDELRIGMSVPYKETYYNQYRHVICAFRAFRRARVACNVISCENEIDGFHNISNEDQAFVKNLIEKENLERRPLPDKIVRKSKKKIAMKDSIEGRSTRAPYTYAINWT